MADNEVTEPKVRSTIERLNRSPELLDPAQLKRLELEELRGALENELEELKSGLTVILREVRKELRGSVTGIQRDLRGLRKSENFDDAEVSRLCRSLEKATRRLASMRSAEYRTASDLAELSSRLEKTRKKLRP